MGAKRKEYSYYVPPEALAAPEKWCICRGKHTGTIRGADGVIRCVDCDKPVHPYQLVPEE